MKASHPRKKKSAREIVIDDPFCKGCGLCIEACPLKLIVKGEKRSRAGYLMPQVIAIESCSACLMCEMLCPDLALTVVEENK